MLRESIAKVGILVPLTVYREKRTKRFIILDGQRRWIVAQELGLKKVPVNEVAEPNLVQNIVTMFQIHKLREDWELMPTALKLEILMRELQERNNAKLAALTGLDESVVVRCKKLLDYPRKYQAMMLDPNPSTRMPADFFIELYAIRNDRFVTGMDWYDREIFTERMLQRYLQKQGIKAVTDFRRIKQHVANARKADREREISRRLHQFVEDPNLEIDHLNIREANVGAQVRKLQGQITGLSDVLRNLDVRHYYGEELMWKALEDLLRLLRRRLEEAGRRVR